MNNGLVGWHGYEFLGFSGKVLDDHSLRFLVGTASSAPNAGLRFLLLVRRLCTRQQWRYKISTFFL